MLTKKEYLAKRKLLLDEAQALLDEGKLEDYEAKCKEIEALDEQFEAIGKAQANIRALQGSAVVADDVLDMAGGGTNDDPVSTVPADKPKDTKNDYLNAWAKVMMGKTLTSDERSVFDETNMEFHNTVQTANTHAVVIPETVTADIWTEAKKRFPIIADTDMTFVPGDLTILQETSSGDDAEWYDEDTEVKDGDFTLGELNLTGCELSKAIPISWKLRKMSIERFIPYITKLLGRKMGAALAKGLVSGKGKPGAEDNWKPEPKGVKTAIEAEALTPQVVTYDATEGIGYAEMTDAMSKVKSEYKNGAAIYGTSATIWGQLANILDGMGRPIFIPDVTGGGIGRMFGLVVKEDDSITDSEVLIGNMADGYAANVNENMTIYTEDHIKLRYTDYMSYTIVDGGPLTTKAFALIKPEAEL